LGPQSLSGSSGEEKNSQPQPGLEPPIIQSVTQRYTTELSGLPNKGRNREKKKKKMRRKEKQLLKK
jgi:hypothetical protein